MSRLETVEEFAALGPEDWKATAIAACRIAVSVSGADEPVAVEGLRRVEHGEPDAGSEFALRRLVGDLDRSAWDARELGDEVRYEQLFRRARAVSAIRFALADEPDEAIYEATHAVGTPSDLVRYLAASE